MCGRRDAEDLPGTAAPPSVRAHVATRGRCPAQTVPQSWPLEMAASGTAGAAPFLATSKHSGSRLLSLSSSEIGLAASSEVCWFSEKAGSLLSEAALGSKLPEGRN